MNNKKTLLAAILLLGLFFLSLFLSDIFLGLGEKSADSFGKKPFSISATLAPLRSDGYFRYAHSLLRDYEVTKNEASLKKSLKIFKKAISLNLLNYQSHQFLGRAILLSASDDPIKFNEALKSFNRAAVIKKADPRVTADTLKIYMSLWPLLSDEQKKFCFTLAEESVLKLNTKDFMQIIETWGLYSKDLRFIKSLMNFRNRFYYLIIKELQNNQLDLKLRQKIVAEQERKVLENSEKKYKEFLAKSKPNLTKLIDLHKNLKNKIKGFYTIFGDEVIKDRNYLELKKKLDIKILKHLLSSYKSDKSHQAQLEKFAFSYLKDFSSVQELDFLIKLFEKQSYFESSNLRNFYLQELIKYKSGDFLSVTHEIENFRKNVTYIKKGHTNDFVKILTLLCDGYISSRLLTKAMDVLTDIENLSPGLESTYWRIIKIENIIGRDEEISEDKEARFDRIRKSNTIELSKPEVIKKVYLLDSLELLVSFNEQLKGKIGEYKLLSLFINGQIFYETYLKNINDVLTIPLPAEMENSEIVVQIRIVK